MSINRPSRVNSTNRVTGNLTVDADGLSAAISGGDGNNTPGNGYKYFRFETTGPFSVGKELIPQQFHINLKEMELLVKL
jgi:hypothetical protein